MTALISVLALLALAAPLTFLLVKAHDGKKLFNISVERLRRVLALVLLGLSFARYIYYQVAMYHVRGLSNPISPFNIGTPRPLLTALAVILIWFSYAAMMAVVMNEFFKYKTLERITNCFAYPVYLIIIVFFKFYGIAVLGTENFALSSVRVWITVLEMAVAVALNTSRIIAERKFEYPKTKRELGAFFYGLIPALACIAPCYVLQAFFAGLDPSLKLYDFTPEHRLMLYMAFVIPFAIFHLLREKDVEEKRFIMIYYSLSSLWIYLGRWNLEMLADPLSWPLHLCNTAMFLVPLCLVFRMNRLFNFCLFINVLGAFIAMVAPDIEGYNAIGVDCVSYWVNHYSAFYMPLLLVALKIFKRPKFKEWVYSLVALTVYFVAMLIVNAWFSNYGECDYFFLNSDFIASKFGIWGERLRTNYVATFTIKDLSFTFYPMFQSLFYVVYAACTVGIWFLYEVLFLSWDNAEEKRQREREYRKMKKEFKEFLGGKPADEPINGDDSPRLTLRNFSKRYGMNNHYSVSDVSFEVKGGEIFGFLGPNGAGKSTIIKSIVGIQTITSGDIEICGYDIDKQPVEAKMNMGFVPDHYALYENLTGREYINYMADLYRVDLDYRNSVIEKYVDRFQLTGSFDNQIKTYSHGMKQKITIMAALVHNPKVWILDEPLTGLDPTSIHEVKECMKEHAAAGNIVFFSSHIIDIVEKICDRIAIIKKGQLRASKTMKELNDEGIELEQFYLDIIENSSDEHVLVENNKKAARGGIPQ